MSIKMQEEISCWAKRGYKVAYGYVRFIVAWKPKDAPKGTTETAVMLADLVLTV